MTAPRLVGGKSDELDERIMAVGGHLDRAEALDHALALIGLGMGGDDGDAVESVALELEAALARVRAEVDRLIAMARSN